MIPKVGDDFTSLDPLTDKKLDHSTMPIARSDEVSFMRIASEMLNLRLEIW